MGEILGRYPRRSILSDDSTVEELQGEIEWIQSALIGILNEHSKVITICARSKRWWNEDIKTRRKNLGRAIRKRRRGEGREADVGEAMKALKRAIRKARKDCWEDFLNRAEGENV